MIVLNSKLRGQRDRWPTILQFTYRIGGRKVPESFRFESRLVLSASLVSIILALILSLVFVGAYL